MFTVYPKPISNLLKCSTCTATHTNLRVTLGSAEREHTTEAPHPLVHSTESWRLIIVTPVTLTEERTYTQHNTNRNLNYRFDVTCHHPLLNPLKLGGLS